MAYKKLKLWFDKELAQLLADKISVLEKDFDSNEFINNVDKRVTDLELKDRVELIADELEKQLKNGYRENIKTLNLILGPENEEETGMFLNYYWIMPIAKYVEKYGLNDFTTSIKMIEAITKRNTGEYTIRPFIRKYPEKTMKVMLKWSKSKNKHVRRLASEGGRPRLPWASKLQEFIDDPRPLLPILDHLKDDSSKYVQKSVANCLNDILKDNFPIGQSLIDSWIKEATKERKWIIKHAIRNLLKQENEWALDIKTQL